MGPMTGRGAGYCSGNQAPGYMNSGRGGGCAGNGFGRGRGSRSQDNMNRGQNSPAGGRFGYSNPPYGYSAEDEIRALKEQADYFQKEAEAVNSRISELEKISASVKEKI